MNPRLTCLVTIHGIGFQQPPQKEIPGYADGLHERLQRRLPTLLGGDPEAEWGRPKGVGPIYVHSDWPVTSRQTEQGLARLGKWKSGDTSHRDVDTTDAPLADGDCPICHVALVYAHLEDQGSHLGAGLETLTKAFVSQGHYASIASIVRMGVVDVWAVIKHRGPGNGTVPPSLRVRSDPAAAGDGGNPSGLVSVVSQLDHDVTTYVCRNDLRERVRSFVHDAVLRLCCREDVAQVVVNSHSQGTVLAFDVLRTLPPFAAEKLACFVTAGSPLRKYVDLFYWGQDAACLTQTRWHNFWDATDPVADPLVPPRDWRRAKEVPPSPGYSELYYGIDPNSNDQRKVHLVDYEVQNAANGAGGGLPAHNYWDNEAQFVQPLANLLQTVVEGSRLAHSLP